MNIMRSPNINKNDESIMASAVVGKGSETHSEPEVFSSKFIGGKDVGCFELSRTL